ncbi:MAG: hypothetical protein ABIQ86_11185 [Steroidobacteraceae bacterium]
MAYETRHQRDQLDPASTVRIDRRQTVLAQLEAVLLANKLKVQETRPESLGTDPYDSGRNGGDAWSGLAG